MRGLVVVYMDLDELHNAQAAADEAPRENLLPLDPPQRAP
jgi:hypothetical protein